jgi:hypothetical protein
MEEYSSDRETECSLSDDRDAHSEDSCEDDRPEIVVDNLVV